MGSIRSSSTAYSSNGIFNRNRINSVYSNPEAGGILPSSQQPPRPSLGHIQHKMSLYDRFVNRKSGRNQKQRSVANLKTTTNGIINKSRPRIPTPDALVEKDLSSKPVPQPNITPVTFVTTSNQNFGSAEFPMVQVVLAPIQESDSSGSVHTTLHANQPNTKALAESVLSPTLTAIGLDPCTAAMLVSKPVTLSIAAPTTSSRTSSPNLSANKHTRAEKDISNNVSSDRKISVTSQSSQQKRNEVYV